MVFEIYRARHGFHIRDEQAAVYGPYLLSKCTDSEITAVQVVELARDPASPIHAWFNWNNHNQQWALYQARTLLRSIEVSIPNRLGVYTRLFYVYQGRYIYYRKVFANELMGREMLQDAAKKLESARERFDECSMIMEAISNG